MAYVKHNWASGDILYAVDMNKMDNQIAADAAVVSELKVATELLNDIPNTTQTLTFGTNGKVSSITYTKGVNVVRTDTFLFTDNTATETRELASGDKLIIVVNKTTKSTTVTYVPANT